MNEEQRKLALMFTIGTLFGVCVVEWLIPLLLRFI